jgi:hypothetical protein
MQLRRKTIFFFFFFFFKKKKGKLYLKKITSLVHDLISYFYTFIYIDTLHMKVTYQRREGIKS